MFQLHNNLGKNTFYLVFIFQIKPRISKPLDYSLLSCKETFWIYIETLGPILTQILSNSFEFFVCTILKLIFRGLGGGENEFIFKMFKKNFSCKLFDPKYSLYTNLAKIGLIVVDGWKENCIYVLKHVQETFWGNGFCNKS